MFGQYLVIPVVVIALQRPKIGIGTYVKEGHTYFVASNLQKKYGFLEEGYKMIAPILHELQKYISTHTGNTYRRIIGILQVNPM